MMLSGLPDSRGLLGEDGALALGHLGRHMVGGERDAAPAAATCIASCLPSAASFSGSASDCSADQHADLAELGRGRVVDIGRDHARIDTVSAAARRTLMFSPILAISWVSVSATVAPPSSAAAASSFSASPPVFERRARPRA